ncbi:putative bifunctional diguanylate cyclase/phosphodiesterase [Marinobacter orientalis]|uniref:cyclic-guanylate-specific phosphodiesterase n=1 Tax=Marinobacter orientalis TaxID=1928859 RepID=A0A7Y0WTL1_9GAMM|nr:EAL domain-containing protein [Marinobacter orientalis]NMT65019.1 EAL domain-containing protein [Marinobacter orientalis]TGX48089.1 EAL domain-containing protein [Marinobacter orientalis]
MSPNQASAKPRLPLDKFLRQERKTILQDWESLDRQTLASARELTSKELQNNLPEILIDLADQYRRTVDKTRHINFPQQGPRLHAQNRWELGFSLEEVAREYGLLRVVILQTLSSRMGELPEGELVFLNEALDKAIVESVTTYVEKANSRLQNERERLQVTLTSIADGVVSTDTEGRITFLNPAAEQISGWPRAEAIGQPVDEVLITLDETTREICSSTTLRAIDLDEPQQSGNILLRRYDGELLPIEKHAAPLRGGHGQNRGAVVTFRDISEIRLLTAELSYLAFHDPLTGLPNRALLFERLTQELAYAERYNITLALLYLDLDLFKQVNDVLGHGVGDELLRQVADRLLGCVRRTDTVSRLGGDEFAVLLTGFDRQTFPDELATKVTKRLSEPFVLDQETVNVSTSIGISVFPEDGQDAESLVKHADTAMYQAKARGRGCIQFFAPEMNRRAKERHELEKDLRAAIAQDQLSLYFQPQISPGTGQMIGVEALLRWHHPQKGLIPPARFIPVAEDSGHLMATIGNWVIEKACAQARAWLDAEHPAVRMSVNVSIAQLRDDEFPAYVEKLLQLYRLPADLLQMELTESIIMSDIEGATERVGKIKDMGIHIAIDDFGTGYSSLSYLKDLPVHELKIDQSFVHNILTDVNSAAIVQAIIRMAQSLKLRVIAEGVEDKATMDFLVENECEGVQGYYFSEPVMPAAFETQFFGQG